MNRFFKSFILNYKKRLIFNNFKNYTACEKLFYLFFTIIHVLS